MCCTAPLDVRFYKWSDYSEEYDGLDLRLNDPEMAQNLLDRILVVMECRSMVETQWHVLGHCVRSTKRRKFLNHIGKGTTNFCHTEKTKSSPSIRVYWFFYINLLEHYKIRLWIISTEHDSISLPIESFFSFSGFSTGLSQLSAPPSMSAIPIRYQDLSNEEGTYRYHPLLPLSISRGHPQRKIPGQAGSQKPMWVQVYASSPLVQKPCRSCCCSRSNEYQRVFIRKNLPKWLIFLRYRRCWHAYVV